MEHIDDYDMLDKDLEGSLRYARECYAAEAEEIASDESRDWSERIRADAELVHAKMTKAEKKKQYQMNTWNKELNEIFVSLEWPLFEKLDAADGYIARMFKECSAMNIPPSMYKPFILEKVKDMIDQIAEKRETLDKQRPNQKEGVVTNASMRSRRSLQAN